MNSNRPAEDRPAANNQGDSNGTRWQRPEPEEARRRIRTKASLALSAELSRMRYGRNFDSLGRTRPADSCVRERELDGFRLAYQHLADYNLAGQFPAWVYEEGRRGRGVS